MNAPLLLPLFFYVVFKCFCFHADTFLFTHFICEATDLINRLLKKHTRKHIIFKCTLKKHIFTNMIIKLFFSAVKVTMTKKTPKKSLKASTVCLFLLFSVKF